MEEMLPALARGGGSTVVLDVIPVGRDSSRMLVNNKMVLPLQCDGVRWSPLGLFSHRLRPLMDGRPASNVEAAAVAGRDMDTENARICAAQL